jgi:hypothetical protein
MMMTMIPRAAQRGIRSSSSVSGSVQVMARINRLVAGVGRNTSDRVALRRPFVTSTLKLSSNGRAPLPPSPRVPPPPSATGATGAAAATAATPKKPIHAQKSTAGTGHGKESFPGVYARTKDRGPVSWPSLFLVTIAAASAVAYYRVERERRLESAMGKVVSSESDGWTPRPDYLAKRQFKRTKWGWFPVEDGFGARESSLILD